MNAGDGSRPSRNTPADPPVLELRGIRKSFPGVVALANGCLEVRAGEIHALVGENGAGKSTLIKILAGAQPPDDGTQLLDGRPVRFRSPHEARQAGIAVIFQEFHLVPALSVRENLFLGLEHARAGWIARGSERQAARKILDRLGFPRDPETPCRDLSVAEQQLVEIAKALVLQARVLVMDEPTAALSQAEVERLFQVVRDLRREGVAVVHVSHRLEELFSLCDRVTVLRDGAHIVTQPLAGLTRRNLIQWMVGRDLAVEFPPRESRPGAVRLVVEGLGRGQVVREVSFQARGGEVLGLAGLVGAGRTELARLLFGADRAEAGRVLLDGRPLRLRSPRDAIAAGICLLTEDRKQQGLVLGQSALANFSLPSLGRFSRAGFLQGSREREAFQHHAATLRLRATGPEQPVRTLSGGNQQKVLLARWLETRAEVFLFDEPTRGVDVGARFEIYQLINELAAAGKVVILISSDLPEVLGMSDRILVLRDGRLSGEIADARGATPDDVLHFATH